MIKRLLIALFISVLSWSNAWAIQPFQPIVPQQTAIAASVIYAGKNLAKISVVSSTNANQWLMIFDGTAVPGNGATSPCSTSHVTGCLAWCEYMTNSNATTTPFTYTIDFGVHPLSAQFGLVALVSTTLCTTETISGSTNFFYGQVY